MNVGDTIPPWALPLTPTTIVSTAIATRDWQDVHHDRDVAQAAGSKDIFMNILTTNGFVQRFVTDWAGQDARIRRVAIRLGAPNFVGDAMRLTGTVAGLDRQARTADIAVSGRNAIGEHVAATVTIGFAEGGRG